MTKTAHSNVRRQVARQGLGGGFELPQTGRGNSPSVDSGTSPVDIGIAQQTIAYIAELTEQLSSLAGGINEDSLAYFLSMARAEAELAILRRSRGK